MIGAADAGMGARSPGRREVVATPPAPVAAGKTAAQQGSAEEMLGCRDLLTAGLFGKPIILDVLVYRSCCPRRLKISVALSSPLGSPCALPMGGPKNKLLRTRSVADTSCDALPQE